MVGAHHLSFVTRGGVEGSGGGGDDCWSVESFKQPLSDSGPLKLRFWGCVHVEDVWSGVAEVRFVFHPSV